MGDKSTQKKQYIIEKAKEVFIKRGYKDVTMKDIVEACQISRGGLYLYFANTKELFEAVLEQQMQHTKGRYEKALEQDATPGEKLLIYLDICKSELLAGDNFITATYEYLFTRDTDNPVSRHRKEEEQLLENIIAEGVAREWMTCDDPKTAAAVITCAIEGLKVAAVTTGITEKAVDDAIDYIMGTLGLEIE